MSTTILDTIQNQIGYFAGASAVPPAGTSSATVTATMDPSQVTDPTNTLRICIEADFGLGFRVMKWSNPWTGGPGQVAPSLTYEFPQGMFPARVRGSLENITQVLTGLSISFA